MMGNNTDPDVRSQTRAFWISAIAALISIVISIASLLLAYKVYIDARLAHSEALFLKMDPVQGTYQTMIDSGGPGPGDISTQWLATIINVSDKPVSITRINGVASFVGDSPGTGFFTKWDSNNLFDEHGDKVSLPLTVEPGKTQKLILKMSIGLDSRVYNALQKGFSINKSVDISAVVRYLRKHGLDYFGNELHPIEGPDGKVLYWYKSPTSMQRIQLIIKTARGNQFNVLASTGYNNEDRFNIIYNDRNLNKQK